MSTGAADPDLCWRPDRRREGPGGASFSLGYGYWYSLLGRVFLGYGYWYSLLGRVFLGYGYWYSLLGLFPDSRSEGERGLAAGERSRREHA